MTGPHDEVEGPFLVFRGYDVPGHDAAYYPTLEGEVEKLKNFVLDDLDSFFDGFNTRGWIKSYTRFDYSTLIPAKGVTLYMRVQYPGWYFCQGVFERVFALTTHS